MLKNTVQIETTTMQTGQPFTASLWLLRNQSIGQGTKSDMKKCSVPQSNRKGSTCIWKMCQYQLQFYSNFWPSNAFYIITMALTFIYVYFLWFMQQCFTFKWRKHDHYSSWTVPKREATGSSERSLTIYQFTRDHTADDLYLQEHSNENLTLPS
jgi:hypothetical protein